MARTTQKYPVGIQSFPLIRQEGYIYVDKTEYVYNMTHSNSRCVFLSRPRRFGKSLLASTLKAYFEGRKELFKGLAIERLEKEWIQHPVLYFSFASAKHLNDDSLKEFIAFLLNDNASRLGIDSVSSYGNIGLMQLVRAAKSKYGQNPVVIIDEYDAPMLDVMHEDKQLENIRIIMRSFYSPLKDLGEDLRFIFLTGITKFSQLSIFSELNNIKNITLYKDYGGICGITEEEMLNYFSVGIEELAAEKGITKDEAIAELKANYDGYHFTWPSADVYNPYSLLNALDDLELKAYWFGSGTPTYLIDMLRKFNISATVLCTRTEARESDFDAPTEKMTTITPLLYQSGYITIEGKNMFGKYQLGIPNKEVRIGLLESLLPYYLGPSIEGCSKTVLDMQEALYNDDIDSMFKALQTFLATIPKVNNVERPEHFEAHWKQMLFIIFSLLGAFSDVEVKTAGGNIDFVARTARRIYLVELKVNQKADVAMNQIELKDYDSHFLLYDLPVIKVGVNFSEKERNITEWVME